MFNVHRFYLLVEKNDLLHVWQKEKGWLVDSYRSWQIAGWLQTDVRHGDAFRFCQSLKRVHINTAIYYQLYSQQLLCYLGLLVTFTESRPVPKKEENMRIVPSQISKLLERLLIKQLQLHKKVLKSVYILVYKTRIANIQTTGKIYF